jgi:hypothetical protein
MLVINTFSVGLGASQSIPQRRDGCLEKQNSFVWGCPYAEPFFPPRPMVFLNLALPSIVGCGRSNRRWQ